MKNKLSEKLVGIKIVSKLNFWEPFVQKGYLIMNKPRKKTTFLNVFLIPYILYCSEV